MYLKIQDAGVTVLFLTSVVTVGTGSQDVCILQPASQGPHPPRAPEKGVPPGAQSAQLLHSSLFRSSVLEPDLHENTKKSKNKQKNTDY